MPTFFQPRSELIQITILNEEILVQPNQRHEHETHLLGEHCHEEWNDEQLRFSSLFVLKDQPASIIG